MDYNGDEKMSEEAFGLPKTTVRASLVLVLLFFAVSAYFVTGSVPEWLIALLSSAVAFYFGTKKVE